MKGKLVSFATRPYNINVGVWSYAICESVQLSKSLFVCVNYIYRLY